MSCRAARLGFLYPGHSAEDDYPSLAAKLEPPPLVFVRHTTVKEDAHRVDALKDLGSDARLLSSAADLMSCEPDVVMWACTSGSFIFGWDGARRQVDALRREVSVPCSSTSFSFVEAAHALGLRSVAVAATYPDDVARAFVGFLRMGDLDVVSFSSADIMTGSAVATLGRDDMLRLAVQGDHPDAEALLIPDTALHTVNWLADLEDIIGKPVLTANQVTIWHGWNLSGEAHLQTGHGALFGVSLDSGTAESPVA